MKIALFKSHSLCVLAVLSVGVMGQAHKQNDRNPEQMRDAQANLPGPAHKQLAALAGEYTTATRFRMSPTAKPIETNGKARLASLLEGRFLTEENSSVRMGSTVAGMRLTGYNNATKQYETSWVYTGSTAILNMTGTSKDSGRTIDWEGSFQDPTGGKVVIRGRTRQLDADHFVVELYGKSSEGTDFTVQETTYTRKR